MKSSGIPNRRTLVVLLLLAGCAADAERSSDGTFTVVDTVGGSVLVRNSGTPPTWTLEPVLRLGSQEGGPEAFGTIRSVVADAEGSLYVADHFAREIRVFAPDGRHLRNIGRPGEGPGEFGMLYGLAWIDGDLAALDPGNARIGVFTTEGEWIRSIPWIPLTGGTMEVRPHSLGGRGFYAPIIPLGFGGGRLPYVRITAAGARDTIPGPVPPEEAPNLTTICHRSDGGISFFTAPEGPSLAFAFPPEGERIAVGWTERYEINWMNPEGDTLRILTRERPRVPYPDELWDGILESFATFRENFPDARCEPRTPERPLYRGAFRYVTFDDVGRMWVEAADESGLVWEVFDPEGRPLGRIAAPPRIAMIPPYIRGGRLYQVEAGELDVQYVAVYRVTEPRS